MQIRDSPGGSLQVPAWRPSARLALFAILTAALAAEPRHVPAAEERSRPDSLPDSVLAWIGSRAVTRAEFLRQWTRLGPALRPAGKPGEAEKRAFLDELVRKEALAQAVAAEPYTPSAEETRRLALSRQRLARREYYQRMVVDSLAPEPPASSHSGHGAHIGHEHGAGPDARERAREQVLVDRLLAPLRVRYDDSTATLLARAFAQLPEPREEGPGWIRVHVVAWLPPVPSRDTARVLARTTRGDYTIGRFLRRWDQVPAGERDRPDDPRRVIVWARNFLAQERIDEEALRLGMDRAPAVEEALGQDRRMMALESYYRKHVVSLVDTSDATLERRWREDPARYRDPPSWLYYGIWYPSREEGQAAREALERDAPWDSMVAARFPAPHDPEVAKVYRSEGETIRELQKLAADAADSTLRSWFAAARPGQVFGPRERTGQWWVYRFVRFEDGKRNTFREARPLVLEEHLRVESERGLAAHLQELTRRYGVRLNQAALADLELPSDSESAPAAP